MHILNKESGVYGLSGKVSSDFRDLDKASNEGNELARQAVEVFCYNAAKYIGAYIAVMNGVDAIIFTAGLGENDHVVRKQIMSYFEYMGVKIDEKNNKERSKEIMISTPDSKVKVYIIPTNEEMAIARETVQLV